MIKKITSIVLVVALLATSISWNDIVYADNNIIYGDADGDGDVDLQDVLLLEKFVSEDEEVILDFEASDVNGDGVIDDTDVVLVKKYLAGWNVVLGHDTSESEDSYLVTFNTDGGSEVDDIIVPAGEMITETIPTPTKGGYIFVEWQTADGQPFYQSNAITSDLELKAIYIEETMQESLTIDTFSLVDQDPDLAFTLVSDFESAAEVKNNIVLKPMDGTAQPDISVVKNSDGTYKVTASNGYNPGSTYELTVGSGIKFLDKEDTIIKASFTIAKTENYNIKYNENVKFIKDTDSMTYSLSDGTNKDVLDIAILSNTESNEDVTGTFTYPGFLYPEQTILCIYENTDPRERDYTTDNYEDDSVAYIRITDITGDVVSFEGLDNADASEVLFMPDSIPFSVSSLPAGTTGSVDKNDYDVATWLSLGKTDNPVYNVGDYLIFYTGTFSEATNDTPVYYAEVTQVNDSTVDYVKVDKSDIEASSGMYISNQVDSQTLADCVDEDALESQVAAQAMESGFVDEAIACLAEKVQETESFQNAYTNLEAMDDEVLVYNEELLAATPTTGSTAVKPNKAQFTVEDVIVDANLIYSDHFEDGIGIELGISATLSVTKKLTTGKEASLKIELSASVKQEIAVDIDVDVDTDWTVYVIIPVLTELYCNSAVEIESYSAISLGAKIYTVSEDVEKKWTALNGVLTDEMKGKLNADTIRQIDTLATRLKTLKKNSEEYTDIAQQILNYQAMLPSVEVEGETYSIEELEEALGVVSVTEELGGLLDIESPDGMDTGIADIMDKYVDMLENESDWVELFNKELFNKDFYVNIVAINLKVNFIVKANVNIALAANLEYQIGKRYTFWVKVFSQQSGSDEVDLCDERFAFQFYVMGTLGIKAGIKAEVSVGLFSTKIGSIGVNVEFGPYFKLWGYFIYEYTKLRPANETEFTYDETMLGAIYMEVGLYVTVKLKAQLLDNTLKYEPTLYSGEYPILTVGQKDNVYDFAMEGSSDDKLVIKDVDNDSTNGITMQLPDTYINMKEIDLKTAEKLQNVYQYGDFIYNFSSDKFSIDSKGLITVTPGQFERYLTCNLTLTWNKKVAFSDYDMSITVPVIWTNYTNKELNEKYSAMVKVGNSTEGYSTKWSDRFSRVESFDLPSQDEILDMINYDSYEYNGVNVKYENKGSYKDLSTDLTINTDTLFYYDIDLKKYTIVVEDVQNPDGITEDKEYTFTYGQDYDFTDLQSTGTSDDESDTYTKFYNITDWLGNEISLTGIVDISFLEAVEAGEISLTANYVDNSATATYDFIGVDVPSVTITFEKGSIPDFDYAEYLVEYEAEAVDISQVIAPAYTSVTYTLNCKSTAVIEYYDMEFNTKGGSTVNTRTYPVASIITRPQDPVYEGYTFKGWYTDENCTIPYEFTSDGVAVKMPANNITLYAKWSANNYNVTFDAAGGEMGTASSSMNVTYGEEYGYLPTPTLTNYRFLGWYTDVDDENTKVDEDTLYYIAGNQTLHAKWFEKVAIVIPDSVYTNEQEVTFEEDTEFEFELNLSQLDGYTGPDWGFDIRYQKEGSEDDPTLDKPISSGTYKVYISRSDDITTEEDDNYLDYSSDKIGTLKVNKASFTINSFSIYNSYGTVIAQTPVDIPGDGQILYQLLDTSGNVKFDWQTSPVFTGVDNGTYYVNIKVEEGTNYKSSDVIRSSNNTKLEYQLGGTYIYYKIKTCKNSSITDNYGTDSDIKGIITLANQFDNSSDGNSYWTEDILDGHGNDFDNDDNDLYFIKEVNAPWQVTGIGLNNTGSDNWKIESVSIGYTSSKLSEDDVEDNNDDSITYAGSVSFNDWVEDGDILSGDYGGCTFMKRNITSVGDFTKTLGTVNLDTLTSDYQYEYNGLATDQYYTDYNVFDKFSAPTMSATFANTDETSTYDRYITYNSCKSICVDYDALRDQMKRDGKTSLTLYLGLSFPSTTTTDSTRIWTNSVTFTCSAATSQAATTYLVSVPSFLSMRYFSDGILTPMLISANTSTGYADKTVDVTVDVSGNTGLWGILADLTYDHDALELVSYKGGSIYSSDDITGPESLDKDKFTFLATGSAFENEDEDGSLITLTFKVKDGTAIGNYKIGVDVAQIIDADGNIIASDEADGTIDVQEVNDNESGTGEGDTGDNDVPPTGDNSNIIVALESMILGLSVFTAAYKFKPKKKRTV